MNELERSFEAAVSRDKRLSTLARKLNGKQSTYEDVYKYAERLAKLLSDILVPQFGENAAELTGSEIVAILSPLMKTSHGLVNDAYKLVQDLVNNKSGIGLASALIKFADREDRIDGMAEWLYTHPAEEHEAFIQGAVENYNLSLVDDDMQENARFQNRSGITVTVTREAEPGCCDWCSALAGTYNYQDIKAGSDVWARHRFCRCTLTFNSEKTVWGNGDRSAWNAASTSQRNRNRRATWGA